ncbi:MULTISPECIES: polysaccharide deacetylase family protein [Rubrivivax]|uniref:Polysaccharide deacetylase family protein n=1 Tax=Rubrivivax benzoatilyticus TaxID=316997 RepID=A0ABX0HS34_9BURK|nr:MULTISPECIES: polysaccharide deacetylase family protein [Rubrivivax]EGJ09781.1 polysaccharide deacetylase [Rubrivivax benzoatilyticus JA2 = ATCC BAA-35]MCD0418131.1 polysaccharide deacetylase family protein [Rubrivivax sp. JA1024]NHK97458.1 polysaccharide deacetylase family protein [Rubrivivax benzoatilyticus]NHL22847.1 polysaccharide deacetylase family protein [Rubrivivax benzoatilyticus]
MNTAPLKTPPAEPPLSVLMYHQFGHFARPKAHRAQFCDSARFGSQLAYLRRMGFDVMSLESARQALFEGAALPRRGVVLTVDDGYQNFADHAWPALQAQGMPATVFIVTSLVGRKSEWLQGFAEQPPLMDAPTLRRLRREGVHFGSHSLTHPRLSRLAPEQMRAEIFDSKAALEDLLGEAVTDFCYPYGDYDERARDYVREAGYRTGLTCIRGKANGARSPFDIPRKAISWGDNLLGFAWKLHFKHD